MEKQRWEESEKRKSQKKEDAGARKGRKVATQYVFPMACGSGGWKSRLAKAAGAEPSGQMRDEKLHSVVARSTFGSQNVQNTPFSDHFWKLRCRKSVRRCGAKHISKSKCTKHTIVGPLLEVEMSKKCTSLWREAHFQVKIKHTRFGPLLEVEMPKNCTSLWREAHFEVNILKNKNTRCSDHFLMFRCCSAWQVQGILRVAESGQNVRVLAVFPKTMAGVGHLQRIWQDACRVAGAVQETCSSEMLGPGADFLKGVAFWSIISIS